MADRNLFNTVTQREEPRKTPSLLEGVNVGMDQILRNIDYDLSNSSYGQYGYGDSKYDWGIKASELDTMAERRAARQSSGEQFLSFLNQAVLGEIVGGTIEGTGYLLDLQSYGNLITGTEKEFGNWFSDVGKKLRTWTEESTPIYTHPDQNKFAPAHWSWWMKNGKSVASTLSLMIPAAGAVRAVGMAGKALSIGSKLSPIAKWATTGISQAVVSRHMENMMEASGVKEEMYKKGLEKGMSPKEAEEYAAKAAAKTYGLDWAMLAQDIPQYLLLNRAFGKGTAKLADKSLFAAAKMGHNLAPIVGAKAAAISWDMLGEGFEEGYQFIAAEEAKYLADKLEDPTITSSFDKRLAGYMKDGEFWTNVAMGALGAGVMQTAGKRINDLIKGGDAQEKLVKSFGAKISHAARSVQFADLLGSESAKRAAITNLENVLFTNGVVSQGMDYVKDMIKRSGDPSDVEMQELGINPEDLETLQLNKEEILKHADDFEKLWENNAKKYDAAKAAKITEAEFTIDSYNDFKNDYKDRLSLLEDKITNFRELSFEAQDIFAISSQILSKRKMIDFQKKRLADTNNKLEKKQRDRAEKLIAAAEKEISILENDIKTFDSLRDDETRALDDKKKIGGPYNLLEAKSDKDITNHSILEYNKLNEALEFADKTLLGAQEDLDKLLSDKPKDKPKPKPSDREDTYRIPEADDYVTYNKDGQSFTGIVDYIDEDGDYHILNTTKWSETSKYATKPTGESVVIPKDKVSLDSKQYIEEDLQEESISSDDTTISIDDEFASDKYLDISYMFDDGGLTPTVTNEELHKFLINPKTSLEGVTAEMHIDTTSDYAKAKWDIVFKDITDKRARGVLLRKIANGKLTDNDINELKTRISFDTIPIAISLVQDGKVLFKDGMFYHEPEFGQTRVPEYIKAQGEDRVTRYLNDQKNKIRTNRFKILPELLKGNEVYSDTLRVTGGHYNNSTSRGSVLERHGLELSEAQIAVSRRNGKMYIDNNNLVAGLSASTSGALFAPTKKTINGKKNWAKINPNKLTKEHAEILWDAIVTRYTKGNGSLAAFPDDRVSGLTVGEVIQMLVLFGERKTNIDHKGFKGEKREDLRNKTLYIHSGSMLTFGNTTINIHETNLTGADQNKKQFIEWATQNKNYSVSLAIKNMGLELNSKLNKGFKIGSWEYKPTEDNTLTPAQILMSIPVDGENKLAVVSDLQEYEGTGSAFVRPNLLLGDNENAIKFRVPTDRKPKVPTETEKSKSRKKVIKKVTTVGSIDSPLDFTNLPVGSVLYYESPTLNEQGEVTTDVTEKVVLATVDRDKKLGRVLNLLRMQSTEVSKNFGQWILLDHEESSQKLDEFVSYLKRRPHISKVLVDISNVVEDEVQAEVKPDETNSLNKTGEDNYSFKSDKIELTVGQKAFSKKWDVDISVKDSSTASGYRLRNDMSKSFDTREEAIAYADKMINKLSPTNNETTDDVLGDIFGTGMTTDLVPEVTSIVDLPKELAWFYDKFGSHQKVQDSNRILKLAADGREAFSIFTSDCIYVFTGAPEGAIYHEAFHRVFLGYLSEDERQKIYDAARKQFKLPNASDTELSELLAEDFRKYRLTNTSPKSRTVWQFFKDLYNFIYTYFTGKTKLTSFDIQHLYDSINRGQYRYSEITDINRKALEGRQVPMAVDIHRTRIDLISNYHDLDKIVKFLTATLIQVNNIDNLNDIKTIKMKPMWEKLDQIADRLKLAISNTQKQLDDKLIPTDQIEAKQASIKVSENFLNILDIVRAKEYSDLFVDKISDQLVKLNVKRIKDEDNDLDDKINNNYHDKYDLASYEINSKDNLLASVKFMIATLKESNKLDPHIGIPEFVDFNAMWNSLMHNLYGISSTEEMMDILNQFSDKESYRDLINKLNEDKSGTKKEQLRAAVQKHRHKFVNFLISLSKDGIPTYKITNADVNSAAKRELTKWNLFFYGSKAITIKSTGLVISQNILDEYYNEYISLSKEIENEFKKNNGSLSNKQDYINKFVSLLNKLGVTVDNISIEELITNRKASSTDDALFQTIVGDFSHIFTKIKSASTNDVRQIFNDEKYIKSLAEAFVNTHPETISDIVLGPSGHQYFVYAQNSYVTDTANKIRKDKQFLIDHLDKIYNDNSYFGQQMLASDEVRRGIEVLTMSMFGEEGSSGDGYLGINPIEDYSFKLTAMANGLVPFPTMADRKTYYILRGLKPFDFNYRVNGDGTYSMPEEIIDILLGYAKSERNRIENAQKTIDAYNEAVKNGDTKLVEDLEKGLVENYHYVIKEGKKIFGKETSSALNYHNFPAFNREGFDFDRDARAEVRQSITDNVREELAYAESLGLIASLVNPVSNKKEYYNRLIDSTLLSENVKKYGSQDLAIKNIIAGFFVNTVIANNEVEKLFSGDPAFYKQDKVTHSVIEDKIKRLSALTSTGDNFSNSVEEAELTDTYFNIVTVETQKYQSLAYSDLVKSHSEIVREDLSKEHPDWTEEQLKDATTKIVSTVLKAYREMDPTDGQAWISPDMYRSLSIRLGEWSPEKQRAFELLQLDRELTPEEEKETLQVTFQPLKLVYFSLLHSNGLAIPTYHKASFATIFRSMGQGKYGVRQIIDMLDRMEAKGKYVNKEKVDMFMMDSATKVGNRAKIKILDDKYESFNDLSKLPIYKQPFSGLRRQLITDTHDVDRTKTGTQFLKIVLSNIFLDEEVYSLDGKNVSGKYIRDIVFNSLNSLSDGGRKLLEDKLGYKNGKIDKKKLTELLLEDAKKSNASEDLLDALSAIDGDDLYLEIDALTDHKWIQSRIISLISKFTVDVKLPGNQLIQFANFGIKSVETKRATVEEELEYDDSDIRWLNDKRTDDLQWMKIEGQPGKVVPMGCIVSINLFKHVIPNYEELTYNEKVQYLADNPEILGYRIPTQGKNSVFMIKVMGVYPETIGDTITLPTEFTALTGSDFDIDKAYVVRYNYYVANKKFNKIKFIDGDTNDEKLLRKIYKERYGSVLRKWEFVRKNTDSNTESFSVEIKDALRAISEITDDPEVEEISNKILALNKHDGKLYTKIQALLRYDNEDEFVTNNKGKSIYDVNSRKAVENRLLDAFFAVMRSAAHFNEVSAPLGPLTDVLKKKAQSIREGEESGKVRPNMYYQSPRFNESVKRNYTGGKDGIGPFALNNVHHVLAQLAELEMYGSFGSVMYPGKEEGTISLHEIKGKDGKYISDWFSALIDAHVDVAKDPYIMDININSFTYNVISILLRGGAGEQAFDFVAQPILREFANESLLTDENDTLHKTIRVQDGVDDEGQPKYKYIRGKELGDYLFTKWSATLTDEEIKAIKDTPTDQAFNEFLGKDISSRLDEDFGKDFIKRQLLVLRAFNEVKTMGDQLNTLVQASQIDTKKFGSNITELRVFMNKIRKAYDLEAFVNIEKILPFNPNTGEVYKGTGYNFLGTYANNAIKFSLDVLSNVSIYATPVFDELFNKIVDVTQNKFTTDSKFVNMLSDEIFTAMVSTFFTSPDYAGINAVKLDGLMTTVLQKLSAVLRNENGKYDDLQNNMFIKYLYPAPTTDEVLNKILPMFISVPIKSVKDKVDRDNMISSFKELMNHTSPEIKGLARQLFFYAYFTSGYRSRLNAFFNLLPNELFKEITIKDPNNTTEYITRSYNELIKKLLVDTQNYMNVLAYKSIVDEVIINNHDNNKLIRLIKENTGSIAGMTFEYKGKKYTRQLAVKLTDKLGTSLILGYNESNIVYRPYIKMRDQELGHIILKFIGYVKDGTSFNPIYVTQNMRSYNARGVVIKETGMDKSIIPAYNDLMVITPELEESFMELIAEGKDYVYMPKEKQLILNDSPINIEEDGTQQEENQKEGTQKVLTDTQLTMEFTAKEEFPFISDSRDRFSTEPQGVRDLVDEMGIVNWETVTKEQWARLREEYKHCIGI